MTGALRVAAVQHDIAWEDRVATFERLAPRVEAAAVSGARLVLLSEMFATGFSMAADRIAEDEGGPTSAFLVDQACRHGVYLGGSIAERTEGDGDHAKPANVFVLAEIDPLHVAATRRRFGFLDDRR